MPLPRKLTQKRELVVTRLRGGGKLVVRVNDGCGRTIYYWGDYDRKITWICRRLLRPGDCFLDFGANFGEVGMFAAKFVGPTGEVHIVEPQPELARFIKFSAELNGFSHVHVHEVGLSTEDGELQLNVPTGNSGAASFDPQLASEFGKNHGQIVNSLSVKVRNARAFLEELQLPPIRILKLDVEGYEEHVLKSATDFLQKNRPDAVLFESLDRGMSFFERGEVKILASLGYIFFQIRLRGLFRVQLKELQRNSAVENGHDFVALSSHFTDQEIRKLFPVIVRERQK